MPIIVPVLNEIALLPELMSHLQHWQRRGCEVLLVDGGGSDGTVALARHQACMVPVNDGGYALLGLLQHLPTLFVDMPRSTDKVAHLTRERLLERGVRLQELSMLNDIDEPSDLQYLPVNLRPTLPEKDNHPRETH